MDLGKILTLTVLSEFRNEIHHYASSPLESPELLISAHCTKHSSMSYNGGTLMSYCCFKNYREFSFSLTANHQG